MQEFLDKEAYFKEVINKLSIKQQDIDAIYYGEYPASSSEATQQIISEVFASEGVMVIAVIWKGDALNGQLLNIQYYDYDYIGRVVEGMNLQLYGKAFNIQYFVLNKWMIDDAYFERLLATRPNAGFVSIGGYKTDSLMRVCEKHNRPYLLLTYPNGTPLNPNHVLTIDNKRVSEMQVAYLYGLGHRKIAYIHGLLEMNSAQLRLDGYIKAMADHDLIVDEQLIGKGTWQPESGYRATQVIMEQDTKPTAIICANDLMANTAIQALNDIGLRVPDDISIIGCDNIAVATMSDPQITTIHIPATFIGRRCAKNMMALLDGADQQVTNEYFEMQLIIRDSTAPPATT